MREQYAVNNLQKNSPLSAADLPKPKLRLIGKPVKASAAEVAGNARARSAVMRVAERMGDASMPEAA